MSKDCSSFRMVNRAISELRLGLSVEITDKSEDTLQIKAIETTPLAEALSFLSKENSGVIIPTFRAVALGLWQAESLETTTESVIYIQGVNSDQLNALSDPMAKQVPSLENLTLTSLSKDCAAVAGILLCKNSRLLPLLVARFVSKPEAFIQTTADSIFNYLKNTADSLEIVARARVPLAESEQVEVVGFRPHDGGVEHIALIVGRPDPEQPVLVRIHSECFTGDLLGSLRCDCGEQLQKAVAIMEKKGGGVLLYLAQEGRGIGLMNKLRAYGLQDQGLDTLDANLQLGFADDERVYDPAVKMLQLLNITTISLMTNNPLKVKYLRELGIQINERIPHQMDANSHNAHYLETKSKRFGHLF